MVRARWGIKEAAMEIQVLADNILPKHGIVYSINSNRYIGSTPIRSELQHQNITLSITDNDNKTMEFWEF